MVSPVYPHQAAEEDEAPYLEKKQKKIYLYFFCPSLRDA